MIKRESQRLQGLVSFLRFQLAFPNCDTMPAHLGQLLLLQLVTIPVAADFLCPKVHVGSWHPEILASFVPMPKATIHEDASAVLAKHNIRMPRQPRIVEPVAEAHSPQKFAHDHLGASVLGTYGSHDVVASLC